MIGFSQHLREYHRVGIGNLRAQGDRIGNLRDVVQQVPDDLEMNVERLVATGFEIDRYQSCFHEDLSVRRVKDILPRGVRGGEG